MRTMRRLFVGLAVATAALSAGVSSAAAKTMSTTVGQTGTPAQALEPGEDVPDGYSIPANGVITSFQSQSSVGGTGTMVFQVLRREPSNALGGGFFQVVGETRVAKDPGNGKLNRYRAHIPVKAGDLLGVYAVTLWSDAMVTAGRIDMGYSSSEPMLGETVGVGFVLGSGRLNESATLMTGRKTPTLPTLSGEEFHDSAPTMTSVTCPVANGQYGGTFQTTGTATGPYPGTFRETGSAIITLQNGHATNYDLTASFKINSRVGRVIGTVHSQYFEADCDAGSNSDLEFNTQSPGPAFDPYLALEPTDTYRAKIVTRSGAFVDYGLFGATYSSYEVGEGFTEQFESTP